jgi:hypothetical protein
MLIQRFDDLFMLSGIIFNKSAELLQTILSLS